MDSTPSGTVTFLFTDVESSTRLWEAHPAEMRIALARHDEILRTTIEGHDGYVFSTAGDAFGGAFDRAKDAVDAAAAAQRALALERWPDPLQIRVRIGLHTGEADERDGDYFGPTVNRAARVMDAGHGGQVLLSDATAGLVDLPEVVDLGEHLLKSLDDPIRLHQLDYDGSPASFPPIRSSGATASTIPALRSRLIGREPDIVSVMDALHRHPVVTLTGAGGSGKTRLAVEIGNRLVPEMPGGVYFVDLGRVSDESMVGPAFAEGLGLGSLGAKSGVDGAESYLRPRSAVVVIDNCEHVIDIVAEIVDRLASRCPDLRMLATSREPLVVEGEQAIRVRGLGDAAAAALFRERMSAPAGADDEDAIAEICRRLDHLPLAIELAAARTSVLTAAEICRHLDDRFALLTGGRRRVHGRQQTLHATVEWSYELLDPEEQRALRALSVMPGAFGVDLARGVLGTSEAQTVDLLEGLIAQSLLQSDLEAEDPLARYRLLETIRAFGVEELRSAGEERTVRDLHAAAVQAILAQDRFSSAKYFETHRGPLGDDLLAALTWAQDSGNLELGCQLAYPASDGLGRGAYERLRALLDWVTGVDDPDERARMWSLDADVNLWASNARAVAHAAEQAIAAAPDSLGAGVGRLGRAIVTMPLDLDAAQADIDASRHVVEALGEGPSLLHLDWAEATIALWQGELGRAAAIGDHMLRRAEGLGAGFGWARSVRFTALAATGDLDRMQAALADDDRRGPAWAPAASAMYSLEVAEAICLAVAGDTMGARRFLGRLWDARVEADIPFFDADMLLALAVCRREDGDAEAARHLCDGTIFDTRWAHSGAYLYRFLSELADVAEPDAPAWRVAELRRRREWADAIQSEGRTVTAIEAELRSLGLR